MRDPRTGGYLASVTSWFYGPEIWVADDPAGEWEQAPGSVLPDGDEDRPRSGVQRRPGRRVQGRARADLGDRAGRGRRPRLRGRRPGPALREPGRRPQLGAEPRPLGPPHPAGLESRRRRPLPPHDRALARRPVAAAGRDLRGRRVALRRRRRDVAPLEHGHQPRVPARGRAREPDPALRPRRPALRRSPRAALDAVPRRRLPLRRRGRALARRRRRTAVRLRVPGRGRPRRPRRRLRDPARRRRRPDHPRRRRPRLGDARRGRELDRRVATDCPTTTPTSPSCARRSTPTARATGWGSTSAPRRARCSARPTPARRGRRSPTTCRRSTPSARSEAHARLRGGDHAAEPGPTEAAHSL